MGLLDKIKKTIKRTDNAVTGGKVVQAVNNGGKAVAPLAKPILTVAGAVVAGGAGAAAGAAVGDVAGKGLSGKSLKAGQEVEVTIKVEGGPLPGAPDPSAPVPAGPSLTPNADQGLPPSEPVKIWIKLMAWVKTVIDAMSDAAGFDPIPSAPSAAPVGASTSLSNSAPLAYKLEEPQAAPALSVPLNAVAIAAKQGKILKKPGY